MTAKEALLMLENERYRRGMSIVDFTTEINIPMSTYAHWIYHNQRQKAALLFSALDKAGFEIRIGRKADADT